MRSRCSRLSTVTSTLCVCAKSAAMAASGTCGKTVAIMRAYRRHPKSVRELTHAHTRVHRSRTCSSHAPALLLLLLLLLPVESGPVLGPMGTSAARAPAMASLECVRRCVATAGHRSGRPRSLSKGVEGTADVAGNVRGGPAARLDALADRLVVADPESRRDTAVRHPASSAVR
jgi:hypothetical protein